MTKIEKIPEYLSEYPQHLSFKWWPDIQTALMYTQMTTSLNINHKLSCSVTSLHFQSCSTLVQVPNPPQESLNNCSRFLQARCCSSLPTNSIRASNIGTACKSHYFWWDTHLPSAHTADSQRSHDPSSSAAPRGPYTSSSVQHQCKPTCFHATRRNNVWKYKHKHNVYSTRQHYCRRTTTKSILQLSKTT